MAGKIKKDSTSDAFTSFCDTIAALRHPKTGCPWDLEQTHKTLRKYMIEEAYEAAEAMGRNDSNELRDELGDVLLQVVLNAQLARDAGTFDIADVIDAINSKMRRRHPHVFGDAVEKKARGKSQIRENWKKIKSDEKSLKSSSQSSTKPGYFADAAAQPATAQALKIGKIASKIRFDWDGPKPVMDKLISEIEELKAEFNPRSAKKPSAALVSEIGDVYFTLAQLCRHLNLDPEIVALDGNRKFLDRFAKLEALAAKKKIDVTSAPQKTLEDLWEAVKRTRQRRQNV